MSTTFRISEDDSGTVVALVEVDIEQAQFIADCIPVSDAAKGEWQRIADRIAREIEMNEEFDA